MIATLFEFDGRDKEEKGQQFVSGRGLYNDGYTDIRRLEPHGFYSRPPAKSQGLLIAPNGNMDEAYVIGVDHPEKRPSGLPPGSSALYDANGNIVKLVGNGLVVDMQANTITVNSGGWTVTASAPITLTAPEVVINGNVQVNGNLNASGSITDGDGDGGA